MAILSIAKESLRIVGVLAVPEQRLPVILQNYQAAVNYLHVIGIISWLVCYLCSALHFILCQANSFNDYFESGLYFVLSIYRLILYIFLHLKISKMSDLWNDLETTINKRKLNQFFCGFFYLSTDHVTKNVNSLFRRVSISAWNSLHLWTTK